MVIFGLIKIISIQKIHYLGYHCPMALLWLLESSGCSRAFAKFLRNGSETNRSVVANRVRRSKINGRNGAASDERRLEFSRWISETPQISFWIGSAQTIRWRNIAYSRVLFYELGSISAWKGQIRSRKLCARSLHSRDVRFRMDEWGLYCQVET